ncbi:response regulator transcription factor [Nocardioides sp. URHA0020]|uniref:response regulator transcription factor n=1 Tax=Nocardioides sp. URHA0020 TaxID=1380392 RepID=UPI0004915100|nr:response regulator transcription factor [Nocardioides sp. URHA0020]
MAAAAPPVRIAINDDYELVVAGVATLLAPYADRIEIVELDSNEPTASDVDIILYDTFAQAQGDGIDVAGLSAGGTPKVVVFTWNLHHELIEQAMAAGAAGYLWKGMPVVRMVEALEKIHAGARVTPPADARPDSETGAWPGKDLGLSAREAEVIALITQGLTNQEIADKAYLSINSVKSYIRNVYRKLGVQRRSQAVAWGLRHGFEPERFRSVNGTEQPDH